MSIAINTSYVDTKRIGLAEGDVLIDEQVIRADYWLDVALEDSFPCSDPVSSMRAD